MRLFVIYNVLSLKYVQLFMLYVIYDAIGIELDCSHVHAHNEYTTYDYTQQ